MTEPGDTFDGYDQQEHLYIILSLRTRTGEVAITNLISHYEVRPRHYDDCLVIAPDEHPWLRRDSCVYFEEAALERYATIEESLTSGELRQHPRCSDELLRRIQEGALASEDVATNVKSAIRESLATDSDQPML